MSTVATIHLLHWPDVQDIRSLLGATARSSSSSRLRLDRRAPQFAPDRGERPGHELARLRAPPQRVPRKHVRSLHPCPRTLRRSGHRPWDVCRVRHAGPANDCFLARSGRQVSTYFVEKLRLIEAPGADSLLLGAGDSVDDGPTAGDARGAVLRLQSG